MIYFIDQSIADEYSKRLPTEEENLFFQDLAASYRHGYCYLCGTLDSIKCLQTHQDKTVKDIYNTIQSHYAESGAAIHSVQKVFVLTFYSEPNEAILPKALESKCFFIHIPSAINSNWKLYYECCLLTENLEDGDFYLFIGKHYCQKRKIPWRRIHFHHENGGGNTTCDVFEKCMLRDAVPTLCIADSDQKHGTTKAYPNRPAIGETLHRLQKKSRNYRR